MNNIFKLFLLGLLISLFSGCATVEGPKNPDDPFESFNRSMHSFNETLDDYVMKPVAKGYQAITPDPVDKGITNFFNNLGEVLTLINDLLQLKIERALETSARIVFNSTFGLFGIMDVATDFGIERHEEDFGQTLAYWGVDSGPYLVLPFFGPSNIRDGIGFYIDETELDLIYDDMEAKDEYGMLALYYIDKRADLLKAKDIVDEAAPDSYAYLRDAWQQRRKNQIYDGNPPEENLDELFEDGLFEDDIIR